MTAVGTQRIRQSFARNRASYHDAASEQKQVAHLLVDRLAKLGAPKLFETAFEFGCGTGHLTYALTQKFRFAALHLNDLIPSDQLLDHPMVTTFRCGDVRDIDWPHHPDLIASASAIQWLDDPQAMIRRAANHLAPGGWLAISGYGARQFQELISLGSAARAPGLCGPDVFRSALTNELEGRIEILDLGEEIRPLRFEDPMSVLRHLRRTGVNAASCQTWTKSRLARFCKDYAELSVGGSDVTLTYHPVWLIARKRY